MHFFLHIWTDYEINALACECTFITATPSSGGGHGRVSVGSDMCVCVFVSLVADDIMENVNRCLESAD